MKERSSSYIEYLKNAVKGTFQKINYFQCQKGNMHDGQKLNFVCMSNKCLQNGLICSICRQKHFDHEKETMPLKNLFQKLRSFQKGLSRQKQKTIEEHLEHLQNIRSKLLYELRVTVEKLASHFMQVQETIVKSCNETKIKILNQMSKRADLQHAIHQVLSNEPMNQGKFEDYIKYITKFEVNFNRDKQIEMRTNLQEIVDQYESFETATLSDLTETMNFHSKIFSQELKNKRMTQRKKLTKQKSMKNQSQMFGNIFCSQDQEIEPRAKQSKLKYSFSPLLKGSKILIQKNGMIAKQTSGSPERYATVNEGLGLKEQKITFRIVKLVHWIGLGICIRQLIRNNKYAFKYEKIGHGSYMVSSNGFTWSHSKQSQHLQNKLFTFQQGQTIDVELKEKQIRFFVRQKKKQLTLQVNLNPQEWNSVCFCVNLCNTDDKVEIINQ